MAEPSRKQQLKRCGIVMPISSFGEYTTQHWTEVRDVLDRSISEADFDPAPVWERSETDIIQGRIVRNLYELPVAVCDISGLNPNVMFELGLRLAFKKPVIIIVDQITRIPFDTNSIEHMIYDGTLHFQKTEGFIADLSKRITDLDKASSNGDYVAFIDTFGSFSTFKPNPKNVEIDEFIVGKLDSITSQLTQLRYENQMMRQVLYPDAMPRNALAGLGNNVSSVGVGWTAERESALVRMWNEGRTASQIANELGELSRNAVIGKAHRLGLKARPTQSSD